MTILLIVGSILGLLQGGSCVPATWTQVVHTEFVRHVTIAECVQRGHNGTIANAAAEMGIARASQGAHNEAVTVLTQMLQQRLFGD